MRCGRRDEGPRGNVVESAALDKASEEEKGRKGLGLGEWKNQERLSENRLGQR